jgi:uncharacterized protein YegL
MKEVYVFLFIVDVSGSMFGQKIASVNAVLAECMVELRQLKEVTDSEIRVSLISFAEEMERHFVGKKPEEVTVPKLEVKKNTDGFYQTTSYSGLYQGLKNLYDSNALEDGRQGKNTFFYFFTDGKPSDRWEYKNALEILQDCTAFKNAERYTAFVGEHEDKYKRSTIHFVNYQADHIMRAVSVPREIGRLQMTAAIDSGYLNEDSFDNDHFI